MDPMRSRFGKYRHHVSNHRRRETAREQQRHMERAFPGVDFKTFKRTFGLRYEVRSDTDVWT